MLSCVYHAYDGEELVATGRLTFDDLPRVGEEVRLNGRPLVVSAVEFRAGEHVVQLAAA
jgi:hypothetical protein